MGDLSCVDIFVDLVITDLRHLRRFRSTNNLFIEERKALTNLEKDHSITFKPCDKGGNTVVMDRDEYGRLCEDLLKDRNCYGVFYRDPTDSFQTELKHFLTDAKI